MTYYSNVNSDLLATVPLDARFVLEVGCGTGRFADAYRARNPNCAYWGIEYVESVAAEAARTLDQVLVGSVESGELIADLDRRLGTQRFDALIFGDVLEHLIDPWAVLRTLRARMNEGATLCICIPNVSHWSLIGQQLRGEWTYADSGLLDRTHLRFFTRSSAIRMIEDAGWTLVDAKPRIVQSPQTQQFVTKISPALDALGIDRSRATEDLSAFQWVLRATTGTVPKPITVAALGLKKVAGVTEARVDHPMQALATLPRVRATWGADTLSLPRNWPPGVFTLHRRFLNDDGLASTVSGLIEKGWVIISDIDDDPHHWPQYVQSDFAAFRKVHAVSVSTPALADMVSKWNPNVRVLSNAISVLPPLPQAARRTTGLRVFFGALNRGNDWSALMPGLRDCLAGLGQETHVTVVHDRAFFEALGPGVQKTFHPTLAHDDYFRRLADSDVALLPLEDTHFNRLKSDLKLIECCAAGTVPICSRTVYGADPQHEAVALFAQTPDEWCSALRALADDPARLATLKAAGRRYVQTSRMHAMAAVERESWYRQLISDRDRLEAERRQRL
jgi:2-polyprenyl-3-methyl-5-hydroxy-6-metoxy-1,4-benzoquinol methylase